MARRGVMVRRWLRGWVPGRMRVDARERARSALGAAIGLLVTGLISRALAESSFLGMPGATLPWLVAPLGASAVLVFAVPASPLAQPWSVIGGNTLSALVGIACAIHIPDPAWAGGAAVGLAIALMFSLRCLHPPGGAMALLAVLSHGSSYGMALFPAMLNSLLLVLGGIAYNRLTGRRYPHVAPTPPATAPTPRSRFSAADLDAALAHYNQVLDVSRDDLEALLHEAEAAAFRRNLGSLRCRDIMTPEPVTASPRMVLSEAWGLMRRRGIKALPVVEADRRVVGIITVADFMRHADLDRHDGVGERLRALMRRKAAGEGERPEIVGEIMTRKVRVASEHRHMIELVPLFSEGGHHHIPIIDGERRLVGIITQTDLVRALHDSVATPPDAR